MDFSVTLQPIAGVEKAKAKGTQRMGDASPMGNTLRVKATERATSAKEEKAKDQVVKVAMFPSVTGNAISAAKRVTSPPTARVGERMRLTRDGQ